jgi:hypothetical protein
MNIPNIYLNINSIITIRMSIKQVILKSSNIIYEVCKIAKLLMSSSIDTLNDDTLKIFRSNTKVSIEDYVYRVFHFVRVEESTIYLCLIYLDKVKIKHKINFSFENFHKFFVTALTTASKYNEDKVFKNSFYSTVGGIELEEFNTLEKRFLLLIDFSLYVKKEEYIRFVKLLKII